MKKNYICTLLLAIIAIFSTMKAQAQEFHFMPKVGFSLATLMGLDGSARSGANVGVSGEYIFPDDMFAVEAGVYYSMQGATKKHNYGGEYISANLNNDYINIPIYAKAYVYKGLNIFAGPQLGFNVHNKFKLDGHKKEYAAVNVDKLFYPFDFSLCVGGGYQFENGLFFTLNYNFGLTDVLKYKDIQIEGETNYFPLMADESTVRNGVFQANIGWRF